MDFCHHPNGHIDLFGKYSDYSHEPERGTFAFRALTEDGAEVRASQALQTVHSEAFDEHGAAGEIGVNASEFEIEFPTDRDQQTTELRILLFDWDLFPDSPSGRRVSPFASEWQLGVFDDATANLSSDGLSTGVLRRSVTWRTKVGPERPVKMAIQEFEDFVWLLSFAHGGGVQIARIDELSSSGTLIRCRIRRVESMVVPFRGPLPFGRMPAVKLEDYALCSTAAFTGRADSLALRSVLHAIQLARAQVVEEARALLLCSVFELLRYSYASNILYSQGLVIMRGDEFVPTCRYPNGRGIPSPGRRVRPLSFKEILDQLCSSIGAPPIPTRVVKFRNSVVHQMVIPLNGFQSCRESVLDVMDHCDKLVLQLLNWPVGHPYFPCNRTGRAPEETSFGW